MKFHSYTRQEFGCSMELVFPVAGGHSLPPVHYPGLQSESDRNKKSAWISLPRLYFGIVSEKRSMFKCNF